MESLKKMFGDSITISQTALALSPTEKKQILERSKTTWNSDTVKVFVCKSPSGILGYGFVDDVKGKVQFITYLVALKPTGEIVDVDVLAYREAYGSEITYESFRKQFHGKTSGDKLLPGKDIKNISGATISVRAITLGVKKILCTYDIMKNKLK
ncbi:MAG: FMN-binding protein [Bacteroidetes bacterium]|nr:MAG: FMN-binding protein [Bacteroidota bacterium]